MFWGFALDAGQIKSEKISLHRDSGLDEAIAEDEENEIGLGVEGREFLFQVSIDSDSVAARGIEFGDPAPDDPKHLGAGRVVLSGDPGGNAVVGVP